MKKTYKNIKTYILNNYNQEIDEKVLDILTISIMSLFIRFPEITKERIPYILNKLEIFYSDKTIKEMVTERYPQYPINEIGKRTSAFVVRALDINNDTAINEEWTMYVSTSSINNNLVNIISKFTHELIHLLRFNGSIDTGKIVKTKEGISVSRYNKETKNLKRKYLNLEEGIVEDFTIKALEALFDYIKNEDVSFSPALKLFKEKFKNDLEESYEIERLFLQMLTKDRKFNEFLEYSFIDKNEPLSLISYYNDIVEDSTAFDTLSRELDNIIECADSNNTNDLNSKLNNLINQINSFLAKAKTKKKK